MITLSAYWNPTLDKALKQAVAKRNKPYSMDLVGEDAKAVQAVVNQGIDSHLESCYVPDRGDSYEFRRDPGIRGQVRGTSLKCSVSPESLPVLIRRLMEDSNEHGESLASEICAHHNIELI